MSFDVLSAILVIPAVSAALLAVLPGYRQTAKLNVVAALATFLTSLSLFVVEPVSGQYLLEDDLNKVSASPHRCSARAISSTRSRSGA